MSKKNKKAKDEAIKTKIAQLQDDPADLLLGAIHTDSNKVAAGFLDSGESIDRSNGEPEGLSIMKTAMNQTARTTVDPSTSATEATHIHTPAQTQASVGSPTEATIVVSTDDLSGQSEHVAVGIPRAPRVSHSPNAAWAEAQVASADGLRAAQQKLQELEYELERLRGENEQLHSQNEKANERLSELSAELESIDKRKHLTVDQLQNELKVLRDTVRNKEKKHQELLKKNDELESRVSKDLRKIRVRERELENRLELLKMEKDSLLRAKDEALLDLKRKLDDAQAEIAAYKSRVIELNKNIENNNDQMSRTVRALRLALTNLEGSDVDQDTGEFTPRLKKAE